MLQGPAATTCVSSIMMTDAHAITMAIAGLRWGERRLPCAMHSFLHDVGQDAIRLCNNVLPERPCVDQHRALRQRA